MFTKKSLVLSSVEDGPEKAVLTLENDGEMISGRLRLYNFLKEPDGILSLGFLDENRVKKCGLARSGNMLFTFKTDSKLADVFSCAVVNFLGANVKPILFGASEGSGNIEDMLLRLEGDLLDEKPNVKKIEQSLDENEIDYDDEVKAEINRAIDKEFECDCDDKCKNCKYKNSFFSIQEEEKIEEKPSFIGDIKGQIDDLFENNPKESFLEEMIPNSKWVRVEFDSEGDYYILGLVYEGLKIKYVCYGVPGVYQKSPPKQLSGYPVWFPLDSEKRESFGYWLTYQDAESGESVKAIVD